MVHNNNAQVFQEYIVMKAHPDLIFGSIAIIVNELVFITRIQEYEMMPKRRRSASPTRVWYWRRIR